MANIKSAKKRIKTSEKCRVANRTVKTRITTVRRDVFEALESGDKVKGQELYQGYCSVLDKAVKKGVIKANSASRRKSRIAKRLATMA